MTRPIPDVAVRFVSEHEGCKLNAYQDSVGIWTIGYGHVGPEVVRGLSIPQSKALDYLRQDLGHAAFRLSQKVRGDVIDSLSDQQYAALLSFVFNLGAGDWTIWKRLNNREFDRVPMEMMKFVNAAGRKIQGLVNRRAAEVVLWSEGDPAIHPEPAPPSSVTRQVGMTPPTTMEKPASTSKTFWAGGTVAAAGVIQGAQQIQALAAPQAANSDLIAKLAGFAAVVIVAAGIAIMVFKWMEAHSARH
jgi:GH24 family phage-related lysozyme (muramidase)